MSSKRKISYKCPFCDKRYTREDLVSHIEDNHSYELPKDFTAFRYVFNYVNKKPLSYHGKCTECGGPTRWDENKGRYNRQCDKQACHDSYVKKFEANMIKTRGVARITDTQEGQLKMLANRRISGEYTFSNGIKKGYTGSYEKAALEFMDKVLHIDPNDIMSPGPILEYKYQNKTHLYITDFYYQPYNLIIEVKDGGDNPNNRNMPEYRAKQIAKENHIIKYTNYNYIRLTNNNLDQLLSIFINLKMSMVDNRNERVIKINESGEDNILNELMTNICMTPVGLKDSDAYIINLPQNNVYSSSIAISNANMDSIFSIDKDSNLVKLSDEESDNIRKTNKVFYKLGDRKKVSSKLESYIGNNITEKELYKLLTGIDLYSIDQIKFNLESITIDDNRFSSKVLEEYILGKSDADIIEDLVNEVINNG
jgi:very-short-patch-repair endonuclease